MATDYYPWGPEELMTSPMWESPRPAPATGFTYSTAAAYLREGQERVLVGSGVGTQVLGVQIPDAGGKKFFLTIEAMGDTEVSFGLAYDGGNRVLTFTPSAGYETYSGFVTLPAGATNAFPVLSKPEEGQVVVAMVSARQVSAKTSPQGWLNEYTLSASAADNFVSVDGDQIVIRDGEGNIVGTIGPQEDGTTGIDFFEGKIPPVPAGVSVKDGTMSVAATWDGTFTGGASRPKDFSVVEVFYSEDSFTTAAQARLGGVLDRSGGSYTIPAPAGDVYIGMRTRSAAGKTSAMSTVVKGVSAPNLDEELAERLDTAEDALVSAGVKDNLISNGYGELNSAKKGWAAGSKPSLSWSSDAPSGFSGSFHQSSSTNSATHDGVSVPETVYFRLAAGEDYALSLWIKQNADLAKVSVHLMKADGTSFQVHPASWVETAGFDEVGNPQQSDFTISDLGSASTWRQYACAFASSVSGPTWVRISFEAAPGNPVDVLVAGLKLTQLINAQMVVDGSIIARHIVASEDVWTKVLGAHLINASEIDSDSIRTAVLVAGSIKANMLDVVANQGDRYMTLLPDGLRLYDTDPEEGEPAISLTTSADQYLSITRDGDTVAGMDPEGLVFGDTLSGTQIDLDGEDLARRMEYSGQGAVQVAYLDVTGRSALANNSVVTQIELMEMTVDVDKFKIYNILVDPILIYVPAGIDVRLFATYTTNGSTPTRNSPNLGYFGFVRNISSSGYFTFGGTLYFRPDVSGELRVLFYIAASTSTSAEGTVQVSSTSTWGTLRVSINDLGFREVTGNMGVRRTGRVSAKPTENEDPPPPPKKKQYTKTYNASNAESYLGDGTRATGYTYAGRVSQGSYGGTTRGNLRGLWIFPNLTSDLSGSTVNSAKLYAKNQHTYAGSGATARFFTHDNTSIPSSLTSGLTQNSWNVKFSRGQGKWVNVPSGVLDRLRSGTVRGFGLSNTGSGSYGYWSPSARLRITYTK